MKIVKAAGMLLAIVLLCTPPAVLAQTDAPLDLKSEPKGVLSPKMQQKLWNAYKTAKFCFDYVAPDPGTSLKVPTQKPAAFSATPWQSPFSSTVGAPQCDVPAPTFRTPQPVPVVKLDETYGARVDSLDRATSWFTNATSYARLTNDPVARTLLRQTVVDWAKGKSLGKGIHVSWGAKPVDYQSIATILAVLSATAEVAPDFTADERAVVGPWLNDLVKQAAASKWLDREDNKVYMRTYAALLYGLIVGDNRPVQDAIFLYKLAVHDMRPDGSWPVDSQRDQRGLHYGSAATSHLVTIATALQAARGIDLFSYEVDGRSVHTAVDFVVASIKDPAAMNVKYAILCTDGGRLNDLGLDHPDLNQYDEAGYLLAYAERFPDRDSSKFILDHFAAKQTMWSEKNGGAPQCLFALSGGDITRPPLVAPPPTPLAKVVVHPHEEISHGDSGPDINSLINVDIEHGKPDEDFAQFNITGRYNNSVHNFDTLTLVINANLNAGDDAIVTGCGAHIETYDDGGRHAAITLTPSKTGFLAPQAACLSGLKGRSGFMTRFVLGNFTDIAIGMVADGKVAAIKNPGLAEFFTRVAMGEVTVGSAP